MPSALKETTPIPTALIGYAPAYFESDWLKDKYGDDGRDYALLLSKFFSSNRKHVCAGNISLDGTNDTAFGWFLLFQFLACILGIKNTY